MNLQEILLHDVGGPEGPGDYTKADDKSQVPVVNDHDLRLREVAEVVLASPHLQMGYWRTHCGTNHCMAGWAIHLAGKEGARLEALNGPGKAGYILLGPEAQGYFYSEEEDTIAWLRQVLLRPRPEPIRASHSFARQIMDPQELDRVLTNHSAWVKTSGKEGAKANLGGADLRCASLRGANLQGANLQGANLQGANLYWANLYGANLRGADLRDANLKAAYMQGADLRGAVGIPVAVDSGDRLRAVAVAATANDDSLQMDSWHTCETTHCIAGWAIHLAGEPGRLLEKMHGPELAGRMLLGHEAGLHFHDSDKVARAWLLSVLDS